MASFLYYPISTSLPSSQQVRCQAREKEKESKRKKRSTATLKRKDITSIVSGTSSPRVGTWCGGGWPSFRLL
ncbi:hypothetical protein C360_03003 [Cryptococcus neoformans Bt15]|nr:hypothetical protein C360_03003 [Cryptococcus neoformans var. grubii Bt15]